jgi:hypothetical protein
MKNKWCVSKLCVGIIVIFLTQALLLSSLANGDVVLQGNGVPKEAEDDLALMMQAIQKFRLEKGDYPKALSDLRHIFTNEEYIHFLTTLRNPDDKGGIPGAVNYIYSYTRPDGSTIGSVKESGTDDVLAYTTTYYIWENGNRGGYVVLRASGSIEFIPIDMMYFQEINRPPGLPSDLNLKSFRIAVFPEQPGSIPIRLLTLEEVMKKDELSAYEMISKPLTRNEAIKDNGAPESIVTLSRLLAYPNRYGIDREKLWQTFSPSQEEFTLQEAQSGAQKLGLLLQLRKASLDELEQINTPALFLTTDNKRIVTLANLDGNDAIVIDRGLTHVVSRETLAQKYNGEALLPEAAQASSAVVAADPVRVLTLQNADMELRQQVKITNRGKEPLVLQIERPIPGVTHAELSSDTVAPGQSATLNLKIKWRTILPGDEQSDFVTLKTNDPLCPRLQLGFKLKLAKP